jgi:metal-responsive CopG/Arc/MetJ family transcriptional regulator
MHRTQIYISEEQKRALDDVSRTTGLSLSQLIRDAIDKFVAHARDRERLKLLREAKGMWAGRKDLPDLEKLRRGWDREKR